MAAVQIAPGLMRWTAPHPDWDGQEGWDREVGCTLFVASETVVLIDPLLPQEGREEFLRWLDGIVGGRPVSVLTTIRWHRRDREALAERYRGDGSRAPNMVPPGVEPRPLKGAGETMFWLPAAAALVPGDRLIGAPPGGLQLCPESWLDEVRVDRRGLAELMRPLLELPVERVLVSHGEPVLRDGRAAVAHALREAGGS